jgi:hypothetical protein
MATQQKSSPPPRGTTGDIMKQVGGGGVGRRESATTRPMRPVSVPALPPQPHPPAAGHTQD